MIKYRISFVGAGRVAEAMSRELHNAGFGIQKIVAETESGSRALAGTYNASWSQDLSFSDSSDVIIVAVPDDRIKEVLKKISCSEYTAVIHTAGSIGLDIFPAPLKHTGVFYPLQTFSKDRDVVFKDLPFFLEASDSFTSSILKNLAESIGGIIHFVDTEHRRLLHIAAVFVCNFVNHMLTAGKMITSEAGFSFEVLKPLINETISKALEIGPENSQTGPAVRFDMNTIEKHLDLLSFSPELQSIYREVTKSIMSFYKMS